MTWKRVPNDPTSSRWLTRMEPDDLARLDLTALINSIVNQPGPVTEEAVELALRRALDGRSPEDSRRLLDQVDEFQEMSRDLGSPSDAAAVLEAHAVMAAMAAAAE